MAINDVLLAEFNRCRDEIDNLTSLSDKLILAQITALGTGLAVLDNTPDVLLGLSLVTSLLWLFWTTHTYGISRLGGYIALELTPRLRALHGQMWVLGWEEYRLAGDTQDESSENGAKETPRNAADWKSLLFRLTTPVLLVIYIVVLWQRQSCALIATVLRCMMIIISAAIFAFAWIQYGRVEKKWQEIELKIRMAASPRRN